jgi:hypothetical protein
MLDLYLREPRGAKPPERGMGFGRRRNGLCRHAPESGHSEGIRPVRVFQFRCSRITRSYKRRNTRNGHFNLSRLRRERPIGM